MMVNREDEQGRKYLIAEKIIKGKEKSVEEDGAQCVLIVRLISLLFS